LQIPKYYLAQSIVFINLMVMMSAFSILDYK
jgi:hypothetical protein